MSFRIIHVEDSEMQTIITERVLTKHLGDKEDYIYRKCGTIAQAIDMLQDGCLDVILLDLMLPDSRGVESVQKIKAVCPETPIIVLTADDDIEVAKSCIRAGADAYLWKSDMKTLPLVLLLIIEKWELRHEQKQMMDRYISIVEDTPDWIIRFTPEGIITFVNKSALEGMKENIENVIGKHVDNYLQSDQSVAHLETIERITPDNPHVNGHTMWMNNHLIQWRKSGIYNSRGRLKEVQAIGKDVTDQHHMMEKLKTQIQQTMVGPQEDSKNALNESMARMNQMIKTLEEESKKRCLNNTIK